jgi:hypothetical protein
MIFNIELPFSLNKTRIGNRIRIQKVKKNTDPAPYILCLLIFYTTFWQIKVFAKSFHEKLSRKIDKFCENCDTFHKSFHFHERSKKCFRPNPIPYCDMVAPYLESITIRRSFSLKHPNTVTVWSYKEQKK